MDDIALLNYGMGWLHSIGLFCVIELFVNYIARKKLTTIMNKKDAS